MKILLIFYWFLYFTVCLFCNVDFVSLGRHVWRCKAGVNVKNNSIANDSQDGNNTIVPIINLITGNQVILIMLSAVAANNAKVYEA